MARRHNMVTRRLKTQTFIAKALDQNGATVEKAYTVIGVADMKTLREKARKWCYDNDLLLLDLVVTDQGDKLYGMAVENFINSAKILAEY